MKYVKSCLIITMLLGVGYSQCDANGDGDWYSAPDGEDMPIEFIEKWINKCGTLYCDNIHRMQYIVTLLFAVQSITKLWHEKRQAFLIPYN